MRRRQVTAGFVLLSILIVACGSDDADTSASDCFAQLLSAASTNTDNLPTIRLSIYESDEPFDEYGLEGDEVECIADDAAPNIRYLVTDGEPAVAPDDRSIAISDGLLIAEPDGDAKARLADPGTTWSDIDGATDVVNQLLHDDGEQITLVLPDEDRYPVRLAGKGQRLLDPADPNEPTRFEYATDVVMVFDDDEAAESNLDTIESLLINKGFDDVTPGLDGHEVSFHVEGSDDPDLGDFIRSLDTTD